MIPNELFAIAPIAVFSLFSQHVDRPLVFNPSFFIKNLGFQIVGVFMVFLPSYLYLSSHDLFGYFWRDAFRYNFDIYLQEVSLRKRVEAFKYIFINPKAILLCSPIFLGMAYFMYQKRRTKQKGLFMVLVMITLIQLYNLLKSGMSFYYYLYSFIPLGGIYLFLMLRENRVKKLTVVELTGIGILVFLVFSYAGYRMIKEDIGYRLPSFTEKIKEVKGQKGQLYVFRNTRYAAINTDLNIISPSRYFFTHQWNRRSYFDTDGHIFESILKDIENYKTKYIVDFSEKRPLNRKKFQAWWDRYIQSHYVLEDTDPDIGAKLWVRKVAQ